MDELLNELKAAYGEGAEFREGQREAIEYAVNGKRVLVVQKTGWGKKFGIFSCDKNTKEKEERNNAYYKPFACINEQSN